MTKKNSEVRQSLVSARTQLVDTVRNFSRNTVSTRPEPQDWSILEVLAHLIDVDYFYLGQALAMRNHDDHHFKYFDYEAWKLQNPDIPTASLEEVIALLGRSQAVVLDTLSTLSDEELAHPGQHPRGIAYTVRDVFLRFPTHDDNHREQILGILAGLESDA